MHVVLEGPRLAVEGDVTGDDVVRMLPALRDSGHPAGDGWEPPGLHSSPELVVVELVAGRQPLDGELQLPGHRSVEVERSVGAGRSLEPTGYAACLGIDRVQAGAAAHPDTGAHRVERVASTAHSL